MKTKAKYLLQISLSILLLGVLVSWIDIDKTKDALSDANYYLLGLAILIVTANRFIMAVKWNMLLRVKGIFLSWHEATRIYYISNFIGLYLPPTIGMDAVRAYYVARNKHSLADVISSILVERFLGLLVLFLFSIFGCLLFVSMVADSKLDLAMLLSWLIGLSVFGVTLFVLTLTESCHAYLLKLFSTVQTKHNLAKITSKLEKLYSSYYSYKKYRKVLFLFFLLTCLEVATYVFRSYVVAEGLGVKVELAYFFAFVPIVMALIRLPISINGFGINELGFVYFLSLVGVSEGMGFSVGLIDHVLVLVAILPGGLFYAFDRHIKEARIAAQATNSPSNAADGPARKDY